MKESLYCLFVILTMFSAETEIILPPLDSNSTVQSIQVYKSTIEQLIQNPEILDKMTPWDFKVIFYHISSVTVASKLTEKDRESLRRDETALIGHILFSLHSRIDPAFDPKIAQIQALAMSYPSFDMVYTDPKDRKDDAKRKAYDADIAAKTKKTNTFTDQTELRHYWINLMKLGRNNLRDLYSLSSDSKEEERIILESTKLDQDTITALTKE